MPRGSKTTVQQTSKPIKLALMLTALGAIVGGVLAAVSAMPAAKSPERFMLGLVLFVGFGLAWGGVRAFRWWMHG